jgi:hypothetical protein
MPRSQGRQHVLRHGRGRIAAARHNDGVGVSHDVQGPRDQQRQRTSVDCPGGSADANLVRGLTILQTGSTEHLQRRGEIEGQDSVKCQNDDVLHCCEHS